MGDGYLLVQWREDVDWFVGFDSEGAAWTRSKRDARKFRDQAEFRDLCRRHMSHRGWSVRAIRFVRVRPRKVSP